MIQMKIARIKELIRSHHHNCPFDPPIAQNGDTEKPAKAKNLTDQSNGKQDQSIANSMADFSSDTMCAVWYLGNCLLPIPINTSILTSIDCRIETFQLDS